MSATGNLVSPADETGRLALIAACRELPRLGLVVGTAGNVGLRRDARHFFVSPSGVAYESLEPEDVPLVDLDGRWYGRCRPSSEWRMHRDLFRAKPWVGAIVHTHSREATALACSAQGIPPFHYMVAAAGGEDVRCAPYHIFGSQALSDAALAALEGRRACLLANHGMLSLGANLPAALDLAVQIEDLAAKYRIARSAGDLQLLDHTAMARVLEKFRTYGSSHAIDDDLTHREDWPPRAAEEDAAT
ncbi:MAG: class II aldolase/adducin family protein [Steroidobacteraceae bacterium]|nr:class II aldolase/adducin family protein [Steroidobacteraceae bacterium]